MDNVVDNSYQGLKYIWPPITSAVALTIGDRFQTCYRVNGMNEAGLITVLTSPKDNLLLIYDETNHPIAYCRISYDEENKGIEFKFENFKSFAMWTSRTPSEAPFVCFEPWNSMGKRKGENTNLKDKMDIVNLAEGKEFVCSYKICPIN